MTVLTIITAWAEWHFRRRYGPTSRLGTGSWYGRLAEWAMGQHSVGCTWTRREEAPVARTVSQTHTHTRTCTPELCLSHTHHVLVTYTPEPCHIPTHTHTAPSPCFPCGLPFPGKGRLAPPGHFSASRKAYGPESQVQSSCYSAHGTQLDPRTRRPPCSRPDWEPPGR